MRITPYSIQKAIRYLKHYGFREFLIRLHEKQEPENISYGEYYQSHKVTEQELRRQRKESDRWAYRPLISYVLTGMTEAEDTISESEIEAMMMVQSYTNWELCKSVQNVSGEYIAFVEAGDTIEADTSHAIARAIVDPMKIKQSGMHWENVGTPDIIYTDEDEADITENIYENPQFKPDYSPALLASDCYIRHLFVVRREIVMAVLEELEQWSSLDELVLHCVGMSKQMIHIPKILYHAKKRKAVRKPAEEQSVWEGPDNRETPQEETDTRPLISIIIPNKDEREALATCLASVEKSTYQNYEVIVIENNSTEEDTFAYYEKIQKENSKVCVVRWVSDGTFNYSAINNYGVSHAKGEYLVFLNNDIELLTEDWLEAMLVQCRQENVAAVGARLYYPDDTIQHAGIVIGIGGHARGIAANMCVGLPRGENGYMNRASVCQNMSAVTAACMMMKRSVFGEVGGFTERLTVAFNDVDLCLKARKRGYLIVYEPYVEAYHYESKSRGQEDTEEKLRRFQDEIEYMRTEWIDILREGDPYYNPNLTRYRTDYSLRGR